MEGEAAASLPVAHASHRRVGDGSAGKLHSERRDQDRAAFLPATGDEQRVKIVMPDGFEYREMEVGLAKTLESNLPGPLSFRHSGTHSSLAIVEHTPQGLVA